MARSTSWDDWQVARLALAGVAGLCCVLFVWGSLVLSIIAASLFGDNAMVLWFDQYGQLIMLGTPVLFAISLVALAVSVNQIWQRQATD